MTDLDTTALRQALKAPGDPDGPIDVTQIMTRGRQVRRRRRFAAVAGGLCVVAVLAGTATAIASLTAAPPAPGQPVGPARHSLATPGLTQHQTAQYQTVSPTPVPSRTGFPAAPGTSGPRPTPAATTAGGATPTSSDSATTGPATVPTAAAQPTTTIRATATTRATATEPAQPAPTYSQAPPATATPRATG